ncbi:HAD-IA family hydrolase [Lysinibacillus sp. BNK-21]|uniref:HAD-IA family hydrolase n=1 Tax=Lysinibacillus sp. BNK-21 TaxID=3376156 RepID=UPI003B43C7D4
MTNFSTIIFDLDNTLIDTEDLRQYRNKKDWQSCYQNLDKTDIIFNPNDLHDSYYIGVVTNSPRSYAEKLLKYHSINYDALVAFHDTTKHKPESEPLLKCLEILDKDITETICIGDNYNDTYAAARAEIFSIGVTWGDSSESQHIENGAELTANNVTTLNNHLDNLLNTNYDAVFKKNNDKLNRRWHLKKYYPYRLDDGTVNPEFKKHGCGPILDLKQGKPNAIQDFYDILNPKLEKKISICVVPSSDKENIDTGIRFLAKKLANNRIDATSCLKRTVTIPKATEGGPRNVAVHLKSIKVINADIIKDTSVLLIDDVTTSGSSLDACKQLLLDAGANHVVKLAIGQTVERE